MTLSTRSLWPFSNLASTALPPSSVFTSTCSAIRWPIRTSTPASRSRSSATSLHSSDRPSDDSSLSLECASVTLTCGWMSLSSAAISIPTAPPPTTSTPFRAPETACTCDPVSRRYCLRRKDCGTTGHTRRRPEAATKKSYGIISSEIVCADAAGSVRVMVAVLVVGSMVFAVPWMMWMFGRCSAAISEYLTQAFSA
ncbi:hypothetical protein PspLS_11185 [Pyricularia sp. CBS 133598]|nr:hypothetical protein PspLS_11185 [Pyricularia sp. CBS 133598]